MTWNFLSFFVYIILGTLFSLFLSSSELQFKLIFGFYRNFLFRYRLFIFIVRWGYLFVKCWVSCGGTWSCTFMLSIFSIWLSYQDYLKGRALGSWFFVSNEISFIECYLLHSSELKCDFCNKLLKSKIQDFDQNIVTHLSLQCSS